MVTGSVFCDVCYNNSFTKLSYFLPGVDVHVQCKFRVNAPTTKEQMVFSVNRTTDRYGVYRLDIPSVDGVDCVEAPATPIQSFCEATLIGNSSVPGCNVPGASATSKKITLKSRSTSNLCVYSLTALTYRPFNNNFTLCANHQEDLNYNSSKFFLPYFPWPQFPPLPPLPSLPPLPPLPSFPPFPSLPPLPQFPPLPSLPPFPPFQFPPPSPLPQPPSLPYPPPNFPPFSRPPAFNPGDPRTLIPNNPSSNPSPPPPFNPSDPRTWIPQNPFLVPPPPPGFDLRDPRTWIPTFPPSPQSHQP
ncbi:RNA-binding protein 12 [Cynara cardunculus var. scolymus]|nr:RNA-binding protein 12 [Cynara cardunculus var. scolymus]